MRNIALAVTLAGCIDEFQGSNVQVDFSPAMPVQASPYAAAPGPDELPSDAHFTLYATSSGIDDSGAPVGHLFEIQRFEIHRIIDLRSPCFIDVGDHVPFRGLHVTEFASKVQEQSGVDDLANPPPGTPDTVLIDVATAMQRDFNIRALAGAMGPKVVSSASPDAYGAFGTSCTDATGFPPTGCTDPASNRQRLAMCEAAWRSNETYFEGTDRILTAPLNGTSHGMVTGLNPINLAPVGGAQFFVDEALDDAEGFAIYWKLDSAPADQLGELLLFGRPEAPTRGVIRVPMTSLVSPAVTANLAIFSNIDDDQVHF